MTEAVNAWLKSYGLKYYLQQESMNAEIDAALEKAESKSGGNGGNRPDAKLILQDSKLDYYTIKIYHSTWHYDEYGRKIHDTIELIPLNKDEYESREQQADAELRTIGIFKGVIKQ